jgi:hypothetical protein
MKIIDNCMECPKNNKCAYDNCNWAFSIDRCKGKKECSLIKDNKLEGLPSYCYLKDKSPSGCPVIKLDIGECS